MNAPLTVEAIEAQFQALPDDVKREVKMRAEQLHHAFANMPKEGFEGVALLVAMNFSLAVVDAFDQGHDTAMKMVVELLNARPNCLAKDVAKFLVEQGVLDTASFGKEGAG